MICLNQPLGQILSQSTSSVLKTWQVSSMLKRKGAAAALAPPLPLQFITRIVVTQHSLSVSGQLHTSKTALIQFCFWSRVVTATSDGDEFPVGNGAALRATPGELAMS